METLYIFTIQPLNSFVFPRFSSGTSARVCLNWLVSILYLLLNSCATYPSVSRSLPYFSPIQNRIAPVAYCLPQLLWFLLLPFLLPFHRTLTNMVLIESDNKFHFFPSILSPFKSLWTLLSSYRKNLRTLSYFTAWHWPVLQSFLVFFPPSLTTLTSIYHKHHHIHFCNEDWEDERLFLVLWQESCLAFVLSKKC